MNLLLASAFFSSILLIADAAYNATSYWKNMVKSELDEALNIKFNTKRAKNVIIFIGDGMGPNTVTATRIYKKGLEGKLTFEKFPFVGLLKTYCNDKMVPDSASTATALFSGVKTNYEIAGVDGRVQLNDCKASLKKEARLRSLVTDAQEAGMKTGFVTTMRVTHATPSALYTHTASRKWECDSVMPAGTEMCKDIARQLVEDDPGRKINVIMGGGRQCLMANTTVTPGDLLDTWTCSRKDGKNLVQTWMKDKQKYAVVNNNGELDAVEINKTEYLLGLFANGHMDLECERNKSKTGMPSIEKMTEVAIGILENNNDKGFFLMVEGGNIDMSHHRGKAKKAITEAAAMDDAVMKAVSMTNPENTLIIVTSDHGHTLSINGYAKRGGSIFGMASPSKADNKNYTVLTYATGGNESYQYSVIDDHGTLKVDRRDPSQDNTNDYNYVSQAAILVDEGAHSGSDVIIYAKGPHGHLFHNIHEQHYVAHAVRYAAGIGDFIAHRPNSSPKFYNVIYVNILLILSIILQCILNR